MTPPRPGWEARVNRWLEGRPPIDRGVSGQSWRTRLASSKTTSKLLCRQSSWITEKDVRELAEQVAEWPNAVGPQDWSARSPVVYEYGCQRGGVMTAKTFALIALGALAATNASAQSVGTQPSLPDLTGVYRCVRNCAGPGPAHIFQRGWELHITNEAGEPLTAWINRPGHIQSRSLNDCAVYSPDGFTIQFCGGAVWVLVEPQPGAPFKQW